MGDILVGIVDAGRGWGGEDESVDNEGSDEEGEDGELEKGVILALKLGLILSSSWLLHFKIRLVLICWDPRII